ncbi:acyl-CoA dehydrogenase [Sulfurimonas sp. HSL3-7]|uniref:acyl-CoA dehydrogenase n=1 Tax=Sulfonitrofixus jiaomeiensis TaxID=3131938 RepID=UPI0031F89745
MAYLLASLLTLVLITLWFKGTRFVTWSAVLILVLWAWYTPSPLFWTIYLPLNTLLLYPPLRRKLFTAHIVALMQKKHLMPKISETEKIALRAGTLWVDGEFFSGKPDFDSILSKPYPSLSKEEKAFLENEVNTLCAMTNDHQVFQKRDLPPEVWTYMKEHRFFGMIIPKEYGGLGFTALGHSAVVQKLASRSQVLAITAMVPNSIGPAELILEHGTQHQKEYYLPRLADGRELPCFALTEPLVGSDATSIRSEGILFKDESGKVKIRLNFEKRYITLGAVATLIGLAFVLKDPDDILGRGEELGITFALVPNTLKGIDQGYRHDPLGVPFINSSLYGKDVILEIDMIVGAEEGIGEGWKMLMESLSVGRGISLPSTSSGGMKLTAHVVGAYTAIREQFGISVSQFEGIQHELGRIAATTYMMDAARIFTIGAIDAGEKPAVINAVMKYHATERFRDVINSGMDLIGGAGIILGERNLLGNPYMGAPIGITVEGANIMTRTLIQFGQGVIRCHPYAFAEIEALESNDIEKFDRLFFSHIGFALRNLVRMLLLSLTRGYLHFTQRNRFMARYEQKLVWSSAAFAFMTDVVMGLYGGGFKKKEMLSARFGDVLSWMYLLSATLRRFESEGMKEEEKVYVEFISAYALKEIQNAFEGIYANIGSGFVNVVFKFLFGFTYRLNAFSSMPADTLYRRLADKLSADMKSRNLLTEGIYRPEDEKEALGALDACFAKVLEAKSVKTKIRIALSTKELQKSATLYEDALNRHVITEQEYALLKKAAAMSEAVVQVDTYKIDDYLARK